MGPQATASAIVQIGANLNRVQQQTEQLSGIDTDRRLRTRPRSGSWSACEYFAHVRDVLEFYTDRLELVLTVDRPKMTATDFNALASQLRYNEDDIEVVLNAIDRQALAIGRRLAEIAVDEWARFGIGSNGDERTVLYLARSVAHEGRHHLFDVERVFRELKPS